MPKLNEDASQGLIYSYFDFDSVYQDVINNNQLLLGMESFQKGYEKAKNISNGQLAS